MLVQLFLNACVWLSVRGAAKSVSMPPEVANRRGGAWELWRDPGLRRLLVVTCLLSSCWDVHAFLVPVLGHERLPRFGDRKHPGRLRHRRRRSAAADAAGGGTPARMGDPVRRDGRHRPPVRPVSTDARALAMGVCSALLGFTLGSTQPMVMSLLHQLSPEHRYGEAVALRVIVNNASSVSIPMVSGRAGSLIGAAGCSGPRG